MTLLRIRSPTYVDVKKNGRQKRGVLILKRTAKHFILVKSLVRATAVLFMQDSTALSELLFATSWFYKKLVAPKIASSAVRRLIKKHKNQ